MWRDPPPPPLPRTSTAHPSCSQADHNRSIQPALVCCHLKSALQLLCPCSCAAFFLCTAWLIYKARATSAQADTSTVTIRDYSVWVRDLPEDTEPGELAKYLEQVGAGGM